MSQAQLKRGGHRWYGFDAANAGTANLIWDAGNVSELNAVAGRLGVKAMWSWVALCSADLKVMQEPYCGADKGAKGGTRGLSGNWSLHIKKIAQMMVGQSNVVGMWLGDEPEIAGFPSNQLCALATTLKRELALVGRGDVWLYYNDGPSSSRFKEGLCKGLDYFSIDACEAEMLSRFACLSLRL